MQQDWKTIEFDVILARLQACAVSEGGKRRLESLTPGMSVQACRDRLQETGDARELIERAGNPPLAMMPSLAETLAQCAREGILTPEQLEGVAKFAFSCGRMRAYLARAKEQLPRMAAYGAEMADLGALGEEIAACVQDGRVTDQASGLLRRVRQRMAEAEGKVRTLAEQALRNRRQYLADGYVTMRQGRYVLPVDRRYVSQFGGVVVEKSAKGNVVFMEPGSVGKMQQELEGLRLEEDAEVRRLLYALTASVSGREEAIGRNMKLMEELDAVFAKGQLSLEMAARAPQVTDETPTRLCGTYHPLLERTRAVPLDLDTGDCRAVVITGPNTGGKTVTLKTVGLLTLMTQCGLHIPCGEGTRIRLADRVLCDIGDSQSIQSSLSTFSGHMTQVKRILDEASRDSLVLLDELGSGTDPREGMGIALAVLEELLRRGCALLTTTHDPAVRAWAEKAPGVLCARMAFDREKLCPLYRLELGVSGESCAIHMARHLGLPEGLLQRAQAAAEGRAMPETQPMHVPSSRLVRLKQAAQLPQYTMGDSVRVAPGGEVGIVYRPADDKGNWLVQVRGEKRVVNHTRLALLAKAEDLYPAGYDFSIVFDTVANRKAAHLMERKFDRKAEVVIKEGKR